MAPKQRNKCNWDSGFGKLFNLTPSILFNCVWTISITGEVKKKEMHCRLAGIYEAHRYVDE